MWQSKIATTRQFVGLTQLMDKFSPSQVDQLKAIGIFLRTRRLEQSMTLEEIAARTQIPLDVLSAIESGQADQLPEPLYLQGILRLYGDALQLDGKELARNLSRNDPAIALGGAQSVIAPETQTVETPPHPASDRVTPLRFSGVYLILLVALAGVVGGLFYFLSRPPQTPSISHESPSPALTPAVSSPTPLAAVTPNPSVQSTPIPSASPGPSLPKATPKTLPVRVAVRLSGTSWLKVKLDGRTAFEGILGKGAQKNWQAKQQIALRVGNAGAVSVSFNQKPPKLLGRSGEVKQVTFTPQR
jgi:cytoskeletal protein RodZ